MDKRSAALEVAKRVERGAAFYPSMISVCAKARLSYAAVRSEYFVLVHGHDEPMGEIYNAAGRRVA